MGRSRPALAAAAVAVLAVAVLLAGCDRPSAGQERPAEAVAAVRGFQSFRGYRPTPVPVRLEIARIGVSTGL